MAGKVACNIAHSKQSISNSYFESMIIENEPSSILLTEFSSFTGSSVSLNVTFMIISMLRMAPPLVLSTYLQRSESHDYQRLDEKHSDFFNSSQSLGSQNTVVVKKLYVSDL